MPISAATLSASVTVSEAAYASTIARDGLTDKLSVGLALVAGLSRLAMPETEQVEASSSFGDGMLVAVGATTPVDGPSGSVSMLRRQQLPARGRISTSTPRRNSQAGQIRGGEEVPDTPPVGSRRPFWDLLHRVKAARTHDGVSRLGHRCGVDGSPRAAGPPESSTPMPAPSVGSSGPALMPLALESPVPPPLPTPKRKLLPPLSRLPPLSQYGTHQGVRQMRSRRRWQTHCPHTWKLRLRHDRMPRPHSPRSRLWRGS